MTHVDPLARCSHGMMACARCGHGLKDWRGWVKRVLVDKAIVTGDGGMSIRWNADGREQWAWLSPPVLDGIRVPFMVSHTVDLHFAKWDLVDERVVDAVKVDTNPIYRVPGAQGGECTVTVVDPMLRIDCPDGLFGKHVSPSFVKQADPMLPLRNLAEAIALPAALLWLRGEWVARTAGAGTLAWDRVPQLEGVDDDAFCVSVRLRCGDFDNQGRALLDPGQSPGFVIDDAWRWYGEHLAEQHQRGAR